MNMPRASIASSIRPAQTPAEELRTTLGKLEAAVGRLGVSTTQQPQEMLGHLDRATELLDTLSRQGGNLAGERARYHTITQQFARKGKAFLTQVGGPAALRSLREATNPPSANWWWTIDERLAEERRLRRRRTVLTVVAVALVFGVLALLYSLFLAPDEATRERFRHEQQAENALIQGDLVRALAEIELALAYAPGDSGLLVVRGVVLQLQGRWNEAEQVFTEAEQASESREAFYSNRAQAYLMGDAADLALEDTQRMLEINPDSAVAYFQMGNVNATLGNMLEASQNYERAAELAAASGQTELEGLARVQLANLMMVLSAPQIPTATTTP